MQLHVQVLLPEHKCHFDYLGIQVITSAYRRVADTVVCVEELKLGMLAKNAECPGFTTLLYLLTTSITDKACEKTLSTALCPDLFFSTNGK
jgi:hypothetical protein